MAQINLGYKEQVAHLKKKHGGSDEAMVLRDRLHRVLLEKSELEDQIKELKLKL